MEWSEATITTTITLLKWIGSLSNLIASHCFLTLKTIVRSHYALCILRCPIGVLGTLRNYDGDENEDVQKATLHVHHAFWTFLCCRFDYTTTTWNDQMLVYFRRETARGLILQSLSELGRGPSLQLQPKFPSFKATGRLVLVWKDAKSIFSVTFSWTSPLSDRKVPIKTMLAFRANPVGVELFSYVNTFCCSIKFAYLLTTWVKTLYTRIFVEWNSKK